MKKIPYGIANFEDIIYGNYYYIDKSQYIQVIEDTAPFVLLVRPRRMGKSLFSSMMMSYYDIAKSDQHDELFGNLWIGQNPTPLANKFVVLNLDFSQVKYGVEHLEQNFETYCFVRLRMFLEYYKAIYTEDEKNYILGLSNAKDAINALVETTKSIKKLPIYLFIDEYDNFTNTVLAARGVKAHHDITHGEGFYRDFFKCCKGTFNRVFMTGVTPVTYDDLSSGFSIATIVSLWSIFNHSIGITETELRQMIEYYRQEGAISRGTEDIVAEMKPWYDNFCFSDRCYDHESTVYNTSSVIRYINCLITEGQAPSDMIDRNARTDYQKLDYLVMAEDLDNRQQRIEILEEICAKGCTTGFVKEDFPAAQAGYEENFKSMLYYFGTLTFAGKNEYNRPILAVPNRTMGELYLNYMLQVAQAQGFNLSKCRRHLDKALLNAAVDGDWVPLTIEIERFYSDNSSIRNCIGGEYDLQGFIRGLLCLNDLYVIWPELELGWGYNDILLVPKSDPNCPTRHSYLIELKNMRAADNDVQTRIDEAKNQLLRYATDKRLRDSGLLRGTDLTPIYMVFHNHKLAAKGKVTY